MNRDPRTAAPGPPRLAVVAAADAEVVARLAALAARPRVRRFRDLYGDALAIRAFDPAALFVAVDADDGAQLGALRMAAALTPRLAVVALCTAAQEQRVRDAVAGFGGVTLRQPCGAEQLAAVVDAVLAAPAPAELRPMLELIRGLSDEINNPLMFLAGHLQLLRRHLQQDPDRLDQVESLSDGVGRMNTTMAKLQLLVRASEPRPTSEPVDLGALAAGMPVGDAGVALCWRTPAAGTAVVAGRADLLRALLEQLQDVATALIARGDGSHGEAAVECTNDAVRLTVLIDVGALPRWQLPRTFEPYHLNGVLQGTPHGLSPFTIRILAQAHGGDAQVRMRSADELEITVEIPRSPR